MTFWLETGLGEVLPSLIREKILSYLEYIISIERDRHFQVEYHDHDRCIKTYAESCSCGNYAGYIVKTNRGEYRFGIQSKSYCCEDWGGHLDKIDQQSDPQRLDEFRGDFAENCQKTKNLRGPSPLTVIKDFEILEINNVIFKLKTDTDMYQFEVYSDHNGYYGHKVIFSTPGGKVTYLKN